MIDEAFIRSIGIIVIAALFVALGARAFALPAIVAYLVAGLVLGPLTGLVEMSHAIQLVSETGIVLLLFVVGLELSFEEVKGVGKVAAIAGSCQILLTSIGGFGLCLALGFKPVPALVIGIALTFSSTVIVVKLLVDGGHTRKHFGQIAIGILLVQDLFVVVLLTLISGLQGGGAPDLASITSGLGKAFFGISVLLGAVLAASRWLLRRPFSWVSRSPETLFIWSLCWCFLIVTATHFLSLSPEIGAFVAGISLAQLPCHRELQRRVRPLMNFFIAVFFVNLGIEMRLDVPPALWGKAAALTAFIVVGKFIIVMIIVARLHFSEKTAYFAALLLTQVSEFSFLFIKLGQKSGYVDQDAVILLGLIGLISITISTIAVVFRDRLFATVRKLGLLRMFRARENDPSPEEVGNPLKDHIIIVGMNSLGRELARRLHDRGEEIVAIDVDPGKLRQVPVAGLLGDADSAEVLREAGYESAKLVVSALHIEQTNDLLAYRCRRAGVPCSIHAADLNALDNLLEMDVKYLIVPKTDGVKRQKAKLQEMGFLEP